MSGKEQDYQLIGREQERDSLDRALRATHKGAGGLIFLAGEAGVGKTRLAREAMADSGLMVLSGEARDDQIVAYGPIIAAFRSYLHRVPDGLKNYGPLAPCLTLLLPELGQTPPAVDQPTMVEAIRAAFVSIAHRQPTVVFLDDLHWADIATLDLLPLLALTLVHESLLVVGAYRSDELPRSHPFRRTRTNLRRTGRFEEIEIEPLDLKGTTALAAAVLGSSLSPLFAATLFDRTQGLPFFVQELAVALNASGRLRQGEDGLEYMPEGDLTIPDTVRDAVRLRLDGFPEHVRRALEGAAVIGIQFDLDLVVELTDAEQGIAEAIERGLISEISEGQCAFRHALVRETLYGDVLWTRRRLLHCQIAAWLETLGARPGIIAEHWLAGRELERARRALLASAIAAASVHAYRDAIQAAQRALELWPDNEDELGRLDILNQIGEYAQFTGDLQEAVRAWREVAHSRRLADDLCGIAKAERHLATIYEIQGHVERALSARLAAATAFAVCGQAGEAAAERLAAVVHQRHTGDFDAAWNCITEATEVAIRTQRIDLQIRALGLEGVLLADQGRVGEGIEKLRTGLAQALEAHQIGLAADIYLQLGFMYNRMADYVGARDAFRVGLEFCQTRGIPEKAASCLGCFAGTLERLGEWERAIEVCQDLLVTNETSIDMRVVAASILGMIYAWQGRAKQARTFEAEAATLSKRIGDKLVVMLSAWTRAYLNELEGREALAAEQYRFILEHWHQIADRYLMIRPLCWAVTFFASQSAEEDARACAKALADIATKVSNPESLAGLAYAIGEIALLEGDTGRAAEHFDQATALLREVAIPYEQARANLRAGIALAAAGQHEAAVTRLSSTYHTARNLQAYPLAQAAARKLIVLGESVTQRLGRKAAQQLKNGGLSRRELEVLQNIAVGRTNREIAQELFLSIRTVEMHVGNILAKLDCRSRVEAVHKANERGLLV